MATKKKQIDKVLPSDEGKLGSAVLRNVKVSPQKARLVVNEIRGKKLGTAVDLLSFSDKKTAPLLKKLLLSAAANARTQFNVDVDELYVKRAWVTDGRRLKRFMPRAQGRATPIIKRHSTITVVLDEK